MLRVCEIFTSLQGETSRAGCPAVFVRLAGCNLACDWCDTVYAREEPGTPRTVEDVAARVLEEPIGLACITGGEPLLQEETPALCALLLQAGRTVLVETNGSFDTSVLPSPVIRILDMKAPSSGETGKMDLSNLARLNPRDEVKFVLADRADYAWAKDLLERHRLAQKATVLFGAVAGRLDPARLAEWILADRLAVRLQVQLHRVLWPDRTRGA
ncbi:MAG: radical SAM protein [Planctomycetota bacterium]